MMRWTPPADGIKVPAWKWCATTTKAGDVRMQITTVGLDIAKNLFQVHGADAQGRVALKRKLARGKVLEFFATLPGWLVGLEACGAAHYWARELTRLGHQVRLMPPQYVRPYVKTNKHDAADAEACCEAVQRPGMRFVPAKSEDQQAMLVLRRVREQLLKQRTATINALRSHLAEFGIVAARRQIGLRELLAVVADVEDRRACRRSPASCWKAWSPTCAISSGGRRNSTAAWSKPPAMVPLANVSRPYPGLDR